MEMVWSEEGVTTSSCQGTDRLQPHGVSLQHCSGASPLVSFPSLHQLVHIKYKIRKDYVYVCVCLSSNSECLSVAVCVYVLVESVSFYSYFSCAACLSAIVNFVDV